MCLQLGIDSDVKIADKDIEVYKVVRVINNKMFTLYRKFPILFNTLYYSELHKVNRISITIGLHSYATLDDAKQEFYSCGNYEHYDVKIIRGVIPKGASYYEGTFTIYLGTFSKLTDDVYIAKSMASNQIVYKEL